MRWLSNRILSGLNVPDQPPASPEGAAVLAVRQPSHNLFRMQMSIWLVVELGGFLVILALLIYKDIPFLPDFIEKWLRIFFVPDFWNNLWEDPPEWAKNMERFSPLFWVPNIGLVGYIVQAVFALIMILLQLKIRTSWFVVDERGIRTRTGYVTIREMNADFTRIQSLRMKSSILQHFFGLADIELHTASVSGKKDDKEETVLAFRNIDDARAVYDLIQNKLIESQPQAEEPEQQAVSPTLAAASALLEEAGALRDSLTGRTLQEPVAEISEKIPVVEIKK
ncbi:MAG: PH domain-containing protein [Acidobacteriota bacterium]|nr:PH domain-containing protein [Acidobacteriota bacterium]